VRTKWIAVAVSLLAFAGVIIANKGLATVDWSLEASWTDACCCKVSCPCFFGSEPTEGYCQGASLVEIRSGHHGDVSLDGITAIVTYQVGQWSKIVVNDAASREQVAAVAALLPKALPFLAKGAPPSVSAAAVVVERDGDRIAYSAPQTSVALTMVRGANGKPIMIHNVPAKGAPFPESDEHTQYKSEHLRHESEDGQFEWSGRNGLAAKLDLSGEG